MNSAVGYAKSEAVVNDHPVVRAAREAAAAKMTPEEREELKAIAAKRDGGKPDVDLVDASGRPEVRRIIEQAAEMPEGEEAAETATQRLERLD